MVYASEAFMGEGDIDLYDITWLMDCIDLESVLDRLDVRIENQRGSWYWGYCPDHFHFVGKEPSHPKWSINEETGMTKCFTEPRVSNLVFTAARIRDSSPLKTAEWILGYSVNSVEAHAGRIKRLISPNSPNRRINAFDISKYQKFIEEGTLGGNSVALLSKSNLLPNTAKKFGCVEFQDGFYHDRMIFPIRDISKNMKGFVATDTLGKEKWLKQNPTTIDIKSKRIRNTTEEDYKKVLYPANFKIGSYLVGEDSFKVGDIAILVEGCRDVMKLRQEGFSGSLGIGGTNLSDDQLLTLSRLAPRKLMVMLDGDDAGRNGAVKIVEKCLPLFREIFIIKLVRGKDPKDLSREEILFHMRRHTERTFEDVKNALS